MSMSSGSEHASRVLVIGIGNTDRGDDGAGVAAARRLRKRAPDYATVLERRGEATGLIQCWEDAERVILIDAVSASERPGTILRFDLRRQRVPPPDRGASTHGFGLEEAVELSRALGRLPREIVLYGIVAESLELGSGLSAAVEQAIEDIVDRVLTEISSMGHDATL